MIELRELFGRRGKNESWLKELLLLLELRLKLFLLEGLFDGEDDDFLLFEEVSDTLVSRHVVFDLEFGKVVSGRTNADFGRIFEDGNFSWR